ncbi:MAG: MFS transporter [bacterium]|nr:MFS transporter [bacterium]
MCLAIATNLPPVFLTTFGETFGGQTGLSEEQLGRIPALVFVGFIAGIAITTPLADRWGAKGFVLFGLGLMGTGLGFLSGAGSYAALLAVVFMLGLGAGVLEVVLSPIVAALQPHRRTSALNWLHSFYCIGAVGTVLIGSAGLYFHVSWRIISLGIIAVPASMFLGFVWLPTPPMVHRDADCELVGSLVRHPFFLAALALICLGGATEIGIAQWLPAYAERGLGYTKATAGVALAAFSVAMVIGRIAVGFIVRRVGAIPLIATSCLLCVGLVLVGCLLPSAPVALAACIMLGFTVCCFWPTTLGLASDRFPRGGASMFGLLAASGNAGCIAMPWLVGVIAEQSRLNMGLVALIVPPILMVLILGGMGLSRKKERRLSRG